MKPVSILVIDDDELDAEALSRVLISKGIDGPIFHADNGEDALAMLRHEPDHVAVPLPAIILLDLNMPRMNGLEFLGELRADPCASLRRLIVFVLTTSESEGDKNAAYDSHIAGYIVKAPHGQNFGDLTALIERYQELVEFP